MEQIALQQGYGVFCAVRAEMLQAGQWGVSRLIKWESVKRWWVDELVRGLLGLSRCEKVVAEAGVIREPSVRGTSAFGSRYQKTGEDTAA
jgi:hypothetical protein